uniref:Uncharacterized protein n=1 Tax=Oryza sativa subsp. japonica TaxID=39947 RepID=Q2R118_ORYSJ|nr:hypothetical protein LOC_Os11g40650 [Oryza sativa Japonica Group]
MLDYTVCATEAILNSIGITPSIWVSKVRDILTIIDRIIKQHSSSFFRHLVSHPVDLPGYPSDLHPTFRNGGKNLTPKGPETPMTWICTKVFFPEHFCNYQVICEEGRRGWEPLLMRERAAHCHSPVGRVPPPLALGEKLGAAATLLREWIRENEREKERVLTSG